MAAFQGKFNTICTKPTAPYHFVDGGDIRGTMDILWQSLASLLLCTYSIQHLAVPYPRQPKNWRERLWDTLFSVARKPMHMMLALVVPEITVGVALVDYLAARASEKEMQKWASQDGTEWSLTHAFFANIGGFVLQCPFASLPRSLEASGDLSDSTTTPSKEATSKQATKHPGSTIPNISDFEWQALPSNLRTKKRKCPFGPSSCPCKYEGGGTTYQYMSFNDIQAHNYPFRNGRFRINPNFIKPFPRDMDTTHISQALYDYANLESTTHILFSLLVPKVDRFIGDCWVLDAKQLRMAREYGIIDKLPSISSNELKDQSKGDALVKVIAMGQIIYLVLQLCLRKAQALPSSLLELMVVAFAACALLTYGLLLNKPQDVGVPRYLTASRSPTSIELAEIILAGPVHPPMSLSAKKGMTTLAVHLGKGDMHHTESRLRGDTIAGRALFLGSILGGTIFGAIHCAAWDFEFPTPIERLLWRIACLIIVILPIANSWPLILRKPFARVMKKMEKTKDVQTEAALLLTIGNGLLMAMFSVYFVCRLFMLCEVVRALFYLPPGAFLTANWLGAIPHLS
jgi:hypothetical protein